MIVKITGKIIKQNINSLFLDVSGICYEVQIPTAIINRLDKPDNDGVVSLVTYHYYSLEPSKSIPVLIGFMNEVEKDFFLQFISVSGIGPRAALKALAAPFSVIAKAIDRQDIGFLRSLPGIGGQRAKEIIAKLQDKIGKFALIQDEPVNTAKEHEIEQDIESEAVDVLVQLQYKRQEAKEMVRLAKERAGGITDTEALLNEVYKQKTKKK